MRFTSPLGLLWLLALIVLIIIYLIKPIYQNKLITTTYIWKETLKKNKKTTPVSKIKNIIIFLLQCSIIILSTFIIANIFINSIGSGKYEEKIIIIDSSANMRSEVDGETRYKRAIEETRSISKETVSKNGLITIILSDYNPSYLLIGSNSMTDIDIKLDALLKDDSCGYYEDNVHNSLELVNNRLNTNPYADVYLVTGSNYTNLNDITLIDVSSDLDWNISILDVREDVIENYIHFYIDVASFKKNSTVNVNVKVNKVNDTNSSLRKDYVVDCSNNETSTITVSDFSIFSYDSIEVTITSENEDTFSYDNYYVVYGGIKPSLSIQYSSSLPNNFFASILALYQNTYNKYYNITIEQNTFEESKSKGFDYYIYEHSIPSVLPTDGVILLINPDKLPSDIGAQVLTTINGQYNLEQLNTHSITNYITPNNITVSNYKKILTNDEFEVLLTCNDDPIFLIKETQDVKIGILGLNLNYSNLALLLDYPVLMINYFDYFLPSLLSNKTVYDIGEEIELNPRGKDLMINSKEVTSDEFNKYKINLHKVGTFDISQKLLSNDTITETIFVKINKEESNFSYIDNNVLTITRVVSGNVDTQLIVVVSSMLLLLVFIERYINSKESI